MNILFAIDRSRDSAATLDFAKTFPFPDHSHFHVLHVIDPRPLWGTLRADQPHGLHEQITKIRTELHLKGTAFLSQTLRSAKLSGETTSNLREGVPGEEILKAITERVIDVVLVGTRGLSGIKRFFLGSVSEWVLTDAPCSVLVVRKKGGKRKGSRGHKLLLATDGSTDAAAAVSFLTKLNLPKRTALTVVHVVEPYDYVTARVLAESRHDLNRLGKEVLQARSQQGAKLLAETGSVLRQKGHKVREVLLTGHAADEILKACSRERPDLVVVGSKGLTGLRRFLLGSVSHKVARHAPCSVLVVRKPSAENGS